LTDALPPIRGDCGTLPTATEKDCVAAPPAPSVATTVTPWLAGPSSSDPFATVTTPVVGLMANRPPALSARP
jgi:hypothetical protein